MLSISGTDSSRVLEVDDAAFLVEGLTLTQGFTPSSGGAIFISMGSSDTATLRDLAITNSTSNGTAGGGLAGSGNITLENVVISGNGAQYGGGIYYTTGLLTLDRVVVDANASPSGGGGLHMNGGAISMVDSAFTNNTTTSTVGAGAYIESNDTLSIVNTTFANNVGLGNFAATGIGLQVSYSGDFERSLTNVTVSGNTTADGMGDASSLWLGRNSGTSDFTLDNVLVAGNTVNNGPEFYHDSAGPLVMRNSLIAGGVGSNGNAFDSISDGVDGNLIGTPGAPIDAMLGTLGDNGGPVPTVPLLAGSPAIDAGNDDVAPALDARGYSRIGTSDIGSYEFGGSLVYTVNSLLDDGAGSLLTLREAVALANADGSPSRIDLTGLTGTITLDGTHLDITSDVDIVGPGTDELSISGNDTSRVFQVVDALLKLSDVTVRDGRADVGGGLLVGNGGATTGQAILTRVDIHENFARFGGAGIYARGDLTLMNVTVSDNLVGDNTSNFADGGGITHLFDGILSLTNTTVSQNRAEPEAGPSPTTRGLGLYALNSEGVELTNVTIADNTVSDAGAVIGLAILLEGVISPVLNGVTVSGNTVDGAATGDYEPVRISAGSGDVVVRNLLVAENDRPTATGGLLLGTNGGAFDIANSLVAAGLRTYDNSIPGVGPTSFGPDVLVGTPSDVLDAKLGSLGDHGGPVPTVSLRADSPAVNAGTTTTRTTDARGESFRAAPDIGSYEFINMVPSAPMLDHTSVAEDAAVGTFVGLLSSTDADLGDVLTYSVVGDAGPFSVDEVGHVTLTREVDFEANASHTMTVRTTDLFGDVAQSDVTIQVDDVVIQTPGSKAGRTVIDNGSSNADTVVIDVDNAGRTVLTINGKSTTIDADAEAVYLDTGDGDDTITFKANSVAVRLTAGAGNDTIIINGGTGNGFAVIDGGEGDDLLVGTEGPDALYGGTGNDTIRGMGGNDLLDGGIGNDVLEGGEGDDTLVGGTGDDAIDGGDGTNTVSYAARTTAVTIDLDTGTAGELGESDTIVNVDNALGGSGDDTILGDDARNHLLGMDGNDTLRGLAGKDLLEGGDGDDELHGGDDFDVIGTGSAVTVDRVFGGGGIDTLFADSPLTLDAEETEDILYAMAA